jgi:hypothetical protein
MSFKIPVSPCYGTIRLVKKDVPGIKPTEGKQMCYLDVIESVAKIQKDFAVDRVRLHVDYEAGTGIAVLWTPREEGKSPPKMTGKPTFFENKKFYIKLLWTDQIYLLESEQLDRIFRKYIGERNRTPVEKFKALFRSVSNDK